MSKLGFGFLRLPQSDAADEKSIDFPAVCRLADAFIERGGSYFDTAYTYHGGLSEIALRECVVKRHPRESLIIADKLPPWLLKSADDAHGIFSEQLSRCGTNYFDVYLIHGMDEENYGICKELKLFQFLRELKEKGLAKRIGFSFHDDPALLERVLAENTDLDLVQLQINYLDWLSGVICSGECYDMARKYGKPIVVMEPVKGGRLANLPENARGVLREACPGRSDAMWALSFARNLPGVETVLSGMNSLGQIEENMGESPVLTEAEHSALKKAAELLMEEKAVECTACGYCRESCPQKIDIPRYFALYNDYARSPAEKWKMEYLYAQLGAIDCIGCAQCRKRCPQHLDIPAWLEKTAEVFK